MSSHKSFKVAKGDELLRLDVWLTRQIEGFSRSQVQKLIHCGCVRVNARIAKEHRKVKAGEQVDVVIPPPRPVELKPEPIPLNILFEDGSIIVIDKPAGLVVHPAPGHYSGTLVNAVLHHCPGLGGIGGELRPGIVHRLDRDTSGVMVVAKTAEALASLAGQFKRREIHKEYFAIVSGILSPAAGVIKTMIGRHATDRKKMSAVPKTGRPAVTRYETVENLDAFSLVCLRPETGRTHQIRVHLAHIGHPVVGDIIYGRKKVGREPPWPSSLAGARAQAGRPAPPKKRKSSNKIDLKLFVETNRLMLHAHKICFCHPGTGRKMEFTAPMPEDMERFLFQRSEVRDQRSGQK